MTLMRLQRALARAGVASRRKAEDLIRSGRVRVDGTPATIGMSVDPDAQRIVIDGRAVRVVDSRVRPAGRSVEVEITLAEGRQRIVRRIAEALDLKIEWLHRVAYGPVRLGKLGEGKWRELTRQEIATIERLKT